MFTKSAAFYDAIYAAIGKDYSREAQRIHALIRQHKRSAGAALLDVACGTGNHLAVLRQWYQVHGLDIDPQMLAIARQRCPGVTLHQGDMAEFALGGTYGAVLCLFSSIGYARTLSRLRQTLQTLARHTAPGGVVLVEPWIHPDKFEEGHLGAVFVDQPDLKLARINTSALQDGISVLHFHYLVGTRSGVEYFTEDHALGLFSHEDYLGVFRAAGLDVVWDPEGLMGRGLYIGRKPRD